ncbi:MAG TPA: Mur ligase family protein [Thermoanaerobaculia bacterium]|jgi:UDP-N-acetylmuramyl tripeptide synthase|nr:Mur ligase family protein [Thermoanaerobaculia bacterium]
MKLLDSRRLTGPNLLWDLEGAVLDVALSEEEACPVTEAWVRHAGRILETVGWGAEELCVRRFPGGASLGLSAQIDRLYTATEVNEWALDAAAAELAGRPPSDADLAEAAARLREETERERNPALLALRDAASARRVSFLWDARYATLGRGSGSLTWALSDLPTPREVPWDQVSDIPVVLVTGTNGKTTTVRLLAAMVRAAGVVVGTTSTDRVEVDGEVLDQGDCSGPGGARTLLRDRRVEVAILETARGGILRRGLAVTQADAAAVTNVAADHLGEFGISDLAALAEAKLVPARVVRPHGRVVLNADDPELRARTGNFGAPVVWFSLDPDQPGFDDLLVSGYAGCTLEEGELVRYGEERRQVIARVDEVPIAFEGAARHNLANALCAIGLAGALGLSVDAMREGLRSFRGTPGDNPGRGNVFEVNGARVLLDYAHNPHGLAALLGFASSLPARRRLIVLGQAGDRSEEEMRNLVRTAWTFRPDRIVVKEMPEMLRGRNPGEIPAILEDELRRLGVPADAVVRAEDDLDAARKALAWARPGDLLLLLVHTRRAEVLELLGSVRPSEVPG